MTGELLQGFFKSITSPDPVSSKPFAADAIISNPPAFAHCHVAEAFGLPLHLTFSESVKLDANIEANESHAMVPFDRFQPSACQYQKLKCWEGIDECLDLFVCRHDVCPSMFHRADARQWQGLGDVINSFRGLTLGLEPLTIRSGPSLLDRLKVPWTYCWSETLIPKPEDWKEHIGKKCTDSRSTELTPDISGFYFLEADTDFEPDADLKSFLEKGDAPVYIGWAIVR